VSEAKAQSEGTRGTSEARDVRGRQNIPHTRPPLTPLASLVAHREHVRKWLLANVVPGNAVLNEKAARADPVEGRTREGEKRARDERKSEGKNILTGLPLKKPGQRVSWTPDAEQLFYKLANDPNYTRGQGRNNVKIANELNSKLKPSNPFDSQSVKNKLHDDKLRFEMKDKTMTQVGLKKRRREEKSLQQPVWRNLRGRK